MIEKPSILSKKPIDLYNEIKYVAEKRYRYNLPENQTELECLKEASNKLSLLRDIC
jgi:hypothetical protein